MTDQFLAILPPVLTGVVSALVTIWISQKKISIENITKERKDWRDKVRVKTLEVHNAMVSRNEREIAKLKVEFRVMLNPRDTDDERLLECIRLPEEGKQDRDSDKFSKEVAFLLKHDWERAKLEASSFFFRIAILHLILKIFLKKPTRQKPNACRQSRLQSDSSLPATRGSWV